MAVSGGKNRVDIFAANTARTGLVKVTALTMVATGTAVTVATDALLKANKNFSGAHTFVRKNKGVEVSLDQDKFSGSLLNAAKIYVEGETATEEYYMDAVVADSPTSAGTVPADVVLIDYLGLDPDDATKMLVLIAFGNFKDGTGSFTQKHNETTKPKVEFVSKKTKAAMVVPIVAFDAALVTAAAAITFTVGDEYQVVQIAAA